MSTPVVFPPDPWEIIDFAIIAVNEEEEDAVRRVFGFTKYDTEDGHRFYSGEVNGVDGARTVVYVSMSDSKGPKKAGELTRRLLNRMHPRFLLVLGIAGGVAANNASPGNVIFSRYLHSSDNRRIHRRRVVFEPERTQPPDDALITAAENVSWNNLWQAHLPRGESPHPLDLSDPPTAEAGEFFSAPDLLEDSASQLFKAMRSQYPRVSAFEMEAGGIARALHAGCRTGEPYVGYLVIKGISDAPSSHRGDGVTNREERKRWARYAAAAGASFAYQLISEFELPSRSVPSPLLRLRPQHRKVLRKKEFDVLNGECVVFHGLRDREYSALSEDLIRESECRTVFTVCAYSPEFFVKEIARDAGQSIKDVLSLPEEDFVMLADETFAHFKAFRSFADTKGEVNRIVLCPSPFDDWIPHPNGRGRPNAFLQWVQHYKKYLEAFLWLNGENVNVYLAGMEALRDNTRANIKHLTDHVIFDGELCLDYYPESQTLLFTFAPDDCDTRKYLLKFPLDFTNHKSRYPDLRQLKSALDTSVNAVLPTADG